MVNNAAALHIMKYSSVKDQFGPFEIAGVIIWIVGFLFEVVGDA